MFSAILLRCLFQLLLLSPFHCQPSCCADSDDDKVTITVVAILATTQNETIDPKLREVAREIRKKYPDLTGFRLARTTCRSIAVGTKEKIALVDDQEASIEAKRCAEKPSRICLNVKAPTLCCVTYNCACGKFMPIVTGYETKNNEQLIVAVMVESCKEKKEDKDKDR
jgi:hypothetical protein